MPTNSEQDDKPEVIDRCLGCGKRSRLLYCEACARSPLVADFRDNYGDRAWNGLRMTGSYRGRKRHVTAVPRKFTPITTLPD